MEHTKHIWRAVMILILVALVGIVGRHFMIPESFGAQGYYRYESLAEFMNEPVIHGSVTACQECHGDVFEARMEGKHASVSCEACHGPLVVHAKGDEKTGDMPINRSHTLCAYCHQKLRARPETISQIDIREHLATLEVAPPEGEIPEGTCSMCHDVHSPSLD